MLQDNGSTYAPGTATHHLTLYRDANAGAPTRLVFGAGTVQWSWGLDDVARPRQRRRRRPHAAGDGEPARRHGRAAGHPPGGPRRRRRASTDTTAADVGDHLARPPAPTVERGTPSRSPAPPPTRAAAVGGVEVSVDGQTWHPATGRDELALHVDARSQDGPATIRARAVDDSGNLQSPVHASVDGHRRHRRRPPACPCTHLRDRETPTQTPPSPTAQAVELGVKFRSDEDGFITGLRFYKGAANTGTHVGHLWSRTRPAARRGDVHQRDRRAAGSRSRSTTPVAVTRDTTYVASYHSRDGCYAVDEPLLRHRGTTTRRCTALADGVDGANGVYRYGAQRLPDARPSTRATTGSTSSSRPTPARTHAPPRIATVAAARERRPGVDATARVTAVFDEPMDARHDQRRDLLAARPAAARPSRPRSPTTPARTATLDAAVARWPPRPPTPRRSRAARAGVTDVAGNALAADRTWTFTTAAPPPPPPTEGPGGPILVDHAPAPTRSAATTRRSCAPRASTRSRSATSRR